MINIRVKSSTGKIMQSETIPDQRLFGSMNHPTSGILFTPFLAIRTTEQNYCTTLGGSIEISFVEDQVL